MTDVKIAVIDSTCACSADGGQSCSDNEAKADEKAEGSCCSQILKSSYSLRFEGLSMQINIDKKTGILSGIIVILLIIIVSMGMSRNDDRGFLGMNGFGMMGSDHNNGSSNLSGADIMFLEMMIPHHQQAIDMSIVALAKSQDSELIALATDIKEGQSAEIIKMESQLDQANAGHGMGHSMGDSMGDAMGGMLTDAELSDLNAATGKNFDLLWLKGMTEHHDGAIHMSQMIEDAKNSEIKRFGENIVSAQSAQIEQMKAMIARLS